MVFLVSPLLPERSALSLRSVSPRRRSLLCAGAALALALGSVVSPLPAAAAGAHPPSKSIDGFTVLQLNIWHQGTQVPEGIERIADVIEETGADVIMLSEAGLAAKSVSRELNRRGLETSSKSTADAGVVSRFPITDSSSADGFARAVLDLGRQEVAVYSGHLEYRYYANYLPRGYGGGTPPPLPTSKYGWDEIPSGPITDTDMISEINRASGRSEAVARTVEAAEDDRSQGRSVLIGGDFNEPSHLDWTERAEEQHDHHGVIMPWDSTLELEKGGYRDAYRHVHPDEITHPGVTWPAGNTAFPTSELSWTPKADERDRIDFVFDSAGDALEATAAKIVGPRTSVVRDEFVEEDAQDEFFTPETAWPSDHKGNLITYSLKTDDAEPGTDVDGDAAAEGAAADADAADADAADADAAAEPAPGAAADSDADAAGADTDTAAGSDAAGSDSDDAGTGSTADAGSGGPDSTADTGSSDSDAGTSAGAAAGTAGSTDSDASASRSSSDADGSEASRPVADLPRTGIGLAGLGAGAVLIGLGALAVAVGRRRG